MNKRSGSVSMYGLLAMAVILISAMGISGFAASGMSRAAREQRNLQAFQAAQAGVEQGITLAYGSLFTNSGVFVTSTNDLTNTLSSISNGLTISVKVNPQPGDARNAYVTSTATGNGYSKSVRVLISAKDVGIWNNAIFAGTGAAGQSINGNVDIRGSVHILGEGEPFTDLNGNGRRDTAEVFNDINKNGVWDPGEPYTDSNGDGAYTRAEPYNDANENGYYDPPLTQTDLSSDFGGTAYVGNHYSGMPLALQNLVPTAPRVGGIESLSTEVRVKNGIIAISGNAALGSSANLDGGTRKGTLDGTYVTDGWGGNQGASSVFSDNGSANPYDVGGLGITMPYITGIGAATYVAKDGSVWSTQKAFLDARSLVCPVTTITATTNNFSYGPDAHGNRITFTKANGSTPAKIDIAGIIKFNSDLQIGDKDSMVYSGNGTVYAPNIRIDGNILPAPGTTFPTTARMGFIAERNMYLACGNGSSQLAMAGAFYAQGTITSAKQNQIAGTFVANFFDMGKNVPNIYQVPSLPYNMPPGMPGDKGYYTLRLRTWRERTPVQAQSGT